MTLQRSESSETAARRWRVALLATCLLFVTWRGAAAIESSQASPGGEANQLHSAIINGDVDSLRYWLEVRHADASSANASEPAVTPLERCLGLAARVLDPPAAGDRNSRDSAAPAVSLRVLQAMVLLLHAQGASVADADRQHFSGRSSDGTTTRCRPRLSRRPPSQPATQPGHPRRRARRARASV